MNIEKNLVYLFRCKRCCSTFALDQKDETWGAMKQWDALLNTDCRNCRKGPVEYLGAIATVKTDVESPR